MAFTVENGSGVSDANSYISVAFADAYHSDRGNAAWTGSDAEKEAALVKATDYIEQKYSFLGEPEYAGQALSWPRLDGEGNELGVPARLKQAVAVLALEALTTDLNPNATPQVKREKVDTLEVEYFEARTGGQTIRAAIDGLLKGLTGGSPFNARVRRV